MQFLQKNIIHKIIIIIPSIIILTHCQKEVVSKREYPRLRTLEVSNISSSGAVFNGEIISKGESKIIDYGFIWEKDESPSIDISERKSLGSDPQIGKFSSYISATLIKNEKYYVKSYLITDQHLVYGNEITFVSLGSKGPLILYFTPKEGFVEDTLIIFGENFSVKLEQNIVKFNSVEAQVVNRTDSSLNVIIPPDLNDKSSKISVSIFGNVTYAPDSFTLYTPILTNFYPDYGKLDDTITIIGSHFHMKDEYNIARFGNENAFTVSSKPNEIKVLVPANLFEPVKISICISGQTSSPSSEFFTFKPPEIVCFSPSIASYNDTVTIIGNNFTSVIDNIQIFFNNIVANIISADANSINAIVPPNLLNTESIISVHIAGRNLTFLDFFTLLPPNILSLSPDSGFINQTIVVNGENFNPINYNNNFYFEEVKGEVTYSNISTLNVIIPDGLFTSRDILVKIKVGEQETIYTNGFHISNSWLKKSTNMPNFPSRIDGCAITNKGFIFPHDGGSNFYVYDKYENKWYTENFWVSQTRNKSVAFAIGELIYYGLGHASDFREYNPQIKSWTRKADFPGTNVSPAAFAIANKGYVGCGGGSDFWEYDVENDKWSRIADLDAGYAPIGISLDNHGFVAFGDHTKLWEYLPNSNIWIEKAPCPFTEYILWSGDGFAVAFQGEAFIFTTTNGPQYEMYKYSPDIDSWTKYIIPLATWEAYRCGGFAFDDYAIIRDYHQPFVWDFQPEH